MLSDIRAQICAGREPVRERRGCLRRDLMHRSTAPLSTRCHYCEQFTVRRAFLEDVRALRVRLVLVGLAHVVLLPFLLLFMLVYFFLQNAQEWHSIKVRSGTRRGSSLILIRGYRSLLLNPSSHHFCAQCPPEIRADPRVYT